MSKVFKFTHYANQNEKRVIEPKIIPAPILRNYELEAEEEQTSEASKEESVANQKAKLMLEQADREIAQLKEQALLEIEQWKQNEKSEIEQQAKQLFEHAKEQGYKQGFEAGVQAGTDAGKKQYEDDIAYASTLIQQAESDWKKRISQAEPYILDLSIEIARKVIQRELTTEPQTVLQMIKETLKQSSELKEITLAVHPNDYELVRAHLDELKQPVSSQASVVLLPDASITTGGCIVRSSLGTLDARVDTQLEEIKKALLDSVEGSEIHELEPIGQI